MINRDSLAYKAGRFVGKMLILAVGFVVGKRWGRRPIDKGFPEKKDLKNIN